MRPFNPLLAISGGLASPVLQHVATGPLEDLQSLNATRVMSWLHAESLDNIEELLGFDHIHKLHVESEFRHNGVLYIGVFGCPNLFSDPTDVFSYKFGKIIFI